MYRQRLEIVHEDDEYYHAVTSKAVQRWPKIVDPVLIVIKTKSNSWKTMRVLIKYIYFYSLFVFSNKLSLFLELTIITTAAETYSSRPVSYIIKRNYISMY